MADSVHNLLLVWKETGLDTITSGMDNLAKTSQTTAKAQDTLGKSLDDTTKSVTKTGKELDTTTKSTDKTGKSTKTLGSAFKDSSLLIAGFASSMVSLYMQYDRINDQTMKINRTRAQLDAVTKGYDITEQKLKASLDAGRITQAEYGDQMEKLASRREALAVREQQYTDMIQDQQAAWLQFAVSVIPAVSTGYGSLTNIIDSLRGSQDAATASTEGLSSVTEVLGVSANTATTTGLVPTVKAMQEMLIGSKNTGDTINTVVNPAVTDLSAGLYETEKSGNIFIRAFKGMGTSIRNFVGFIKIDMASATGIVDKLKAGFTSFFSLLGTGIKAGIKAFASFATAMLTNPVLLIITGISVAVIALITNLGGFRDAVNATGVAIGNAIPGLKGFLDWIGQGGNAALDAAASLLGFETNAQRLATQAAMTAAILEDPLLIALNKVVDIGPQAEKLGSVIDVFEGMKKATNELANETGYYEGKLLVLGNRWEEVKKIFVNASGETKLAIDAVTKTIREMEKGNYDAETATKMISDALKYLDSVLGGNVDQIKKNVAAEQEHKKSMEESNGTFVDAKKYIADYDKGLKNSEEQYQKFAVARTQGNQDIIDGMQLEEEELQALLERYTKDFPDGAQVVLKAGKIVVQATTDMSNSFLEAKDSVLLYSREQEYAADVFDAAASGVMKDSTLWAEAIDRIRKKYPELSKDVEQVRDDIVKSEQDQAEARKKEMEEVDKQIDKAENFAESRQKEIEANQILTQETQKLIQQLNIETNVTDMTGKGLQELISIYDQTQNATRIAADAIGVWYAELQKNQVIETESIKKLEELATSIHITIPEAIKSEGVPAIKAYIEQILGIGDAAKKARDEALQAFDDLSMKAQAGLADLINEDLIKGDLDEVIEKIEETGRSIEQVSVQSFIIKPFLDSYEFEDDLIGLTDLMGTTWGEMDLKAKDGGDQVMQTFFDGLRNAFGEDIEPFIKTMDTIWTNLKKETPGKTGYQFISDFMSAMNKPSEMERLTSGLAAAGAKGFESGSHLFATAADKAMYELLKPMAPARAEAYAKANEIGADVPKGTAAGIKAGSDVPAQEMLNMGKLMVGQLNQILTDEINTTIPGFTTMLAGKFTEMGNTAKNLATAADTHFKTVQTSLSTLSAAFTGLYNTMIKIFDEITTEISQWATDTKTYFGDVQNAGSTLQSAITGLYNTWDSIMDEMTNKVKDFASACDTAFKAVGTSANTAKNAVDALQKAINSLKDKTVTITYRIETVGSPPKGARFGGSTVLGYARRGSAWIQDKPRNIGGMNVAEFSKPEILTATPLTNPYDVSDKSIDLGRLGLGGIGTGKGTGGSSPIVVSGDLYVTVRTASGEVLATEVKPYLLRGFSGIT